MQEQEPTVRVAVPSQHAGSAKPIGGLRLLRGLLWPPRRLWLAALAVPLIATVVPQTAAASACSNEAFRRGPSAELPDCRAYEQVSPAEKGGLAALTLDQPVQATSGGDAVSYLNFFNAYAGSESASLANAYISRRTEHGWQTVSAAPPTPDATPPGGDEVTYMFSEDLAQWVVDLPLQQLAEGAPTGVYNVFLNNGSGKYTWINNVMPEHLPPEGCPSFILVLCYQLTDRVVAAGASGDFHHLLVESTAGLEGAPVGRQSLYESAEEGGQWHLSLVGRLPDGNIAEESTAGSGSSVFYGTFSLLADNRIANAISQDGSRVVFQASSDEGELPAETGQAGLPEVYERVNGTETLELSAPTPGATLFNPSAQPAEFWAASANGQRVFFTSKADLTSSSYTGTVLTPEEQVDRGDLYEYDLETKTLTDLSVDANLPADEELGADVQGVLGASNDGSYVYFVAKGQLVAGKGVDHADNLYMVHDGGAPVYITTLNENDVKDWYETGVELESYVTPDGKHVAFTSENSLASVNFPSGYDNVNEQTGNPEPEVYEYAAPTESLVCVSCNPLGSPPIGAGRLGNAGRGETPNAGGNDNSAFHHVRVVSDDGGRVFFSSRDPLVHSADGNTQAKVYEYERQGEGSCETSGGCVYLLSSPNSPEEAFFMDADSTGENVFLATVSQLTSTDADHQYDVYDARVGGGLEAPATPSPCVSDCRETSTGLPSTPAALSGFAGPSGNLAPPPAAKAKQRQKLRRALKACHRKHGKRRRHACEARARKRYAKAAKSGHGKRRGR